MKGGSREKHSHPVMRADDRRKNPRIKAEVVAMSRDGEWRDLPAKEMIELYLDNGRVWCWSFYMGYAPTEHIERRLGRIWRRFDCPGCSAKEHWTHKGFILEDDYQRLLAKVGQPVKVSPKDQLIRDVRKALLDDMHQPAKSWRSWNDRTGTHPGFRVGPVTGERAAKVAFVSERLLNWKIMEKNQRELVERPRELEILNGYTKTLRDAGFKVEIVRNNFKPIKPWLIITRKEPV